MIEIKNLVEELNKYRNAYYNENRSLVSDKEYDELFDRLVELEKSTGIIYANSPTQQVGYPVSSKLAKVKHSHPLLSLDKTTDLNDFADYFQEKPTVLMAKMDGLTCSLTYRDGMLVLAESRGDGYIGEDITQNAMMFVNIPKKIPYAGELIIDGECIIDKETFNEINAPLVYEATKKAYEMGLNGLELNDYVRKNSFANSRNLASGTVRQLDSKVVADRKVKFIAWKLHSAMLDETNHNAVEMFYELGFQFLRRSGFTVAPYMMVGSKDCYSGAIKILEKQCEDLHYPIDGIVGAFNDVAYGNSLGSTSHHPKHSLAFKFYQEPNETTLLDIEWSTSRTGQINPVAIVDPVEIDGTIVSRASLSNVSIIKELELGIGDTVTIIKANQIIPAITNNLTRSNAYEIPDLCPDCGAPAVIKNDTGREVLFCTNEDCFARKLDKLVNFAGKSGMDIVGLSEERLKSWMKLGFITDFASIYNLENHRTELELLAGFGKSSVDKILQAIEDSRNRKLENVIVAIGIPGIGKSSAKTIARHCESNAVDGDNPLELLIYYGMNDYDWTCLEDFGKIMSNGINQYIQGHAGEIQPLYEELKIEHNESATLSNIFGGQSFCITGKLEVFANRNELVAEIEKYGGKIVSGVTAKTNYLITNDKNSGSSKNQKAAKYGTHIITEDEFIKLIKN